MEEKAIDRLADDGPQAAGPGACQTLASAGVRVPSSAWMSVFTGN